MQVRDLTRAMERIAPPACAEPWDKVGLQAGRAEAALRGPVLLTIDLTEAVLAEAIEGRCGAIVAYHPPIFEPLNRVTSETPRQRVVLGAIEAGLAIYTPHTALDAAAGGVTDWLCEGLSGSTQPGRIAGDCRALEPWDRREPGRAVKIVTFVPESALEKVRNALASAGAGIIGDYRVCSFESRGRGTFLAGESASPAVGARGQLEAVEERRLEMVCSRAALPLALETLREFHPYEEPAVDVYERAGEPERKIGAGRRLVLDQPATIAELADRLKAHLGRSRVRVAPPDAGERRVRVLGVVPGAGEGLARRAGEEGCELFVTGEMRHHQVLGALHAGLSVMLAGHTNTERGYLPRLADRLRGELPGLEVRCAQRDRDPLETL